MINDTSRYIDDIFTIDNPEFEKCILDIQGVSENMQQILISTKIRFKSGWIKVIHQIVAYNHTILLNIKSPENDTK